MAPIFFMFVNTTLFKRLFPAITMLLLGTSAYGQQPGCSTTEVNAALAATNPAFARSQQQQKQDWADYNAALLNGPQSLVINNASGSVSYEIPVVFHIVHTGQAIGTPQNPADTTIQQLVSYLNAVYNATQPGNPGVNNGGVNIPVQFALAKRSPTCGTTTGINRVNGSSLAGYSTYGVRGTGATNGAQDSAVKALSRWPNTRYLNIWIVTNIQGSTAGGGGVAGYSYFPGAPANIDGIVLRYDQTTWAIAHEVGHSMGLYHTFQGGSGTSCPTNANCATDGDMVCDTDPHKLVSGCPTGTNSCTGAPYGAVTYNIMNYSSCPNRFTAGQRTRLLFQLLNYRGLLASSLGSLAPGVYPTNIAAPATACVPAATTNPGNNYDVGPGNVTFGTLSYMSGGYTTDGFRHYIDHTVNTCDEGQAFGRIAPGTSTTLSITLGDLNPENARAWIDWNGDGVFQTSEQVLTFNGTVSGQTATASVTPPATALTCTPLRMRVVSDFASGANNLMPCANLAYGQAEDFTIIVQAPTATPSVTISRSGGSVVCANSPVTFTATPTNGGSSPSYQWKVNGTNVGTNSPTFTASNWTTGSTVSVVMTSSLGCAPFATATSPTQTITVTQPPAMPGAISGATSVCQNSVNTYSVAAVSGLTYNWTLPAGWGGTSTTATISTTAGTNGGTISVKATNGCTSAARTMAVTTTATATPTISIAAPTTACAGSPVTFTATATNGGNAPAYQWKVNGVNAGTNSNIFTTSNLTNGAIVYCVLTTTNSACATTLTAISNQDTIKITPRVTPTISITPSWPTVCMGDTVRFTATATNGGTAPTYRWTVNGNAAGTNTATLAIPANASSMTVRCVLTSNTTCAMTTGAADTAIVTANPLVTPLVSVAASPAPPFATGRTVVFNATVSGGGSAPALQWLRNGQPISGATATSWTATAGSGFANSDVIGVRLRSNATCARPDTARSNMITTVVTPSAVANLQTPAAFQLYPNPFQNALLLKGLEAGDVMTLVDATGKTVFRETFMQAGAATVQIPELAPGAYWARFARRDGQQWSIQLARQAH